MLIGLWRHHVPVDLILFADPGAEQPHTYAYLDTMSRWLENHGMPAITRVWYTEKNGQRLTLEQECLRSGTLPSIAYGYKKCSLKHKVAPQEKFCRHYQPCIDAWAKGEKVIKFIGYDAGEEQRMNKALVHDLQDKKYRKEYPLMEWGWSRNDCIQAIQNAGLPLPGKSSCFFCLGRCHPGSSMVGSRADSPSKCPMPPPYPHGRLSMHTFRRTYEYRRREEETNL